MPSAVAGPPVAVLVVASSGRLLAESLAAGGRVPDVIDCFGDSDCRAAARTWLRAPAGRDGVSPDGASLLPMVADWAQRNPGGRLIVGSGFEHQPEVLAGLAGLLPMAGNAPAVVAACKDPWRLYEACQRHGIATPAIGAAVAGKLAPDPARWLVKQRGGSGGQHVQPLAPGWPGAGHGERSACAPAGEGDHGLAGGLAPAAYRQQFHAGDPVSLQFLAHARGIAALGTQRLLLAPCPTALFRFGGVVEAELPVQAATALRRAARLLSREFGLRGLNGIDALWDGTQLWVLEINPRPTASLALLAPAARAALVLDHLACTGDAEHGPRPAVVQRTLNAGMAVVYASRLLSIPADFRFPPDCHDLPTCPQTIPDGAPVCSLHTSGGGLGKLRDLCRDLRERLLPLAGVDCLSSV